MLRDESTVLTDDHHSWYRRSATAVARARLLDFDARVLADRPLTVVAAGAAAGAASLERGYDLLFVGAGNTPVVRHVHSLMGVVTGGTGPGRARLSKASPEAPDAASLKQRDARGWWGTSVAQFSLLFKVNAPRGGMP